MTTNSCNYYSLLCRGDKRALARLAAVALGMLCTSSRALANPGDLDPTFGQGGTTTVSVPGTSSNEAANAVVVQPDGKALIVGTADSNIAILRLNADGTPDTSFGFGGKVASDVGYEGNGVALLADGRFIIAGSAYVGSQSRFLVARYLVNGDLDTTFGTLGSTTVGFGDPNGTNQAAAVAIQSDGKIIVVGRAQEPGSDVNFGVVRLNADGSLDSTFGTGGIVSTDFPGPNGPFDTANAVALQPDGKILVAGETNSTSNEAFAVARYLSNGTLDSSFGTNGLVTFTYGTRVSIAYAIALQSTGKIIVGGAIIDGTGGFMLGRLNSDGTLDTSFGNLSGVEGITFTGSVQNIARGMVVYPDNSILMAGSVQSSGQSLDYGTATFSADGSSLQGTRYSANLSASYREEGRALARVPGGNNIFIVGVTDQNDVGDVGVVHTDTSVHVSSFGQFPGPVAAYATAVAVQSDGKIVAAGTSGNNPYAVSVARLNGDGTRDVTFGNGGVVSVSPNGNATCWGLALQPDGKIVAAGYSLNNATGAYQLLIVRFLSNGALDLTFGAAGIGLYDSASGTSLETFYKVRIQADGKIVAAGYSDTSWLFARVLSNGLLDSSFGTSGLVRIGTGSYGGAVDFQLLTSGKIIAVGYRPSVSPFVAVQLNSNGALDNTFGTGGVAIINTGAPYGSAQAVAVQPDGKLVITGDLFSDSFSDHATVVRCLPNGALDSSFGTDGIVNVIFDAYGMDARGVKIQTDGRIVVGAYYQHPVTFSLDFALLRLLSNGTLDSDFGVGGLVLTAFPASISSEERGIAIQDNGSIIAAGGARTLTADRFAFARYVVDPLAITTAVSRETQGSAGTFDINLPLTGPPGVECRTGGANGDHTFVFIFSNNLLSGDASVTGGTGSVSGSPIFTANTMTVNLTGVANAQTVTVTLSNVTDTFSQVLPNIVIRAGFLLGDTNGNGVVSSSDISQTKAQSGHLVDQSNFREDVSANGVINTSDIALLKSTSGTSLNEPPAITSANNTTFAVGGNGSFTVTTTGFPMPTLSESGALPSGVTFDAPSGVLSGTPTAGTGGAYPIIFTASNGVGSDAMQSFTLTVNEAPAITSANSTTFTVGSNGGFTVTTTGFPTPTSSESGALPSGVTFDAPSGVLSGTPAAGTGGIYPITFTASNGVGSDAMQSFTLTVNEAPAITSANSTTFTVGANGGFTVTMTGFPTPTSSESGALPSGVTFNTAAGVLSGTPGASTGGTYPITFTASNGVGSDAIQSFTLTVNGLDGFNPNANGQVSAIVVQPDGKILIGGQFTTLAPNGGVAVTRNRIARLNPDGTLDTAFNPNVTGGEVLSLALQADGKILVGGFFTSVSGQTRHRLARLDATTGLADSFNPSASSYVRSIAVQADGKIVAVGDFTGAIGGQTRNHIVRLDPTTGLADSFNPNANDIIYGVAVQADGKIVVGGDFTAIGGQTRHLLARLDPTTGLADSFNPNANSTQIYSIAVQADGKILAGGNFTSIGGSTRNRIARLDPTTGLADSFNPNSNSFVYTLAAQADGKVLAGGLFTSIGGHTRNYIAQLDATTGLADALNPNANDTVYSIAVQADGNILVGGFFTSIGGATRNRIARFNATTGSADSSGF